jgi:transforming growth factor-beta-induced protein
VLEKVLQNHAISNFVGYLPDLVDGAPYTTLAGNTVTISVKNKAYFVNGVQIISTNTITANGVAHVINGVGFPFFFYFFFSFPSLFRGLCCGV